MRNYLIPEAEQPLWILPTLGGTARSFSNIQAHDATVMPDGKRILYANGTDLLSQTKTEPVPRNLPRCRDVHSGCVGRRTGRTFGSL